MPDSMTLADGTDPNQSPGKPFTRRMWAGGEVYFNNQLESKLQLDGSRVACVERIADVAIKGHEGSEKLFVRMERLIGKCDEEDSDEMIRLCFAKGEGVAINEIRNIFFSRPLGSDDKGKSPKPLKHECSSSSLAKAQHQAEFTHTFHRTAKPLFRYSALTFNTHAIHRDLKFCQEVEQYPELIFHGPLSFTFLTTFHRHELARHNPKSNIAIKQVKYRNTHPLYNEQPVKLCRCKVSDDQYELWEETPEGNVAVQYSATVEELPSAVKYQDLLDYGLVKAE